MKKLVLLLVISLGLVSAVNAESVCKEQQKYDIPNRWLVDLIDKGYRSAKSEKTKDKIYATWSKLVSRSYMGEIKRSDKESLCLSMDIAITDYLKTTLTPQEIERFEKFLIKNESYESYEENKDDYLNALKFLKHFNKMEYWYSRAGSSDIGQLVGDVKEITNYNNNPNVYAEKFVYDESLGYAFQFHKDYTDYSLNGMKQYVELFETIGCENVRLKEDCHRTKELKYIIQWAESKLKEAK